MEFLAQEISTNTYVNIMHQYHPCFHAAGYPPMDRRITKDEFEKAVFIAHEAGIRRLDGITA